MANQVNESVLDTILDDVNIIPSGCTTFMSAFETMVKNRYESVYYEVNHMIKKCEISDGKKFIDIEIKLDGDIVSHIDCNMKNQLVIGTSVFDSTNRIVITRCHYCPKFFRIFIDDEKDTIYLFYRVTILSNLLRHQILSAKTLICDNIKYSGGIATKSKN